MLIFVDESGCPGFKLGHGSDRIFGIGMVLFADGKSAAETEKVVRELHVSTKHRSEFKFSKCCDDVRDQFFDGVKGCPFAYSGRS